MLHAILAVDLKLFMLDYSYLIQPSKRLMCVFNTGSIYSVCTHHCRATGRFSKHRLESKNACLLLKDTFTEANKALGTCILICTAFQLNL